MGNYTYIMVVSKSWEIAGTYSLDLAAFLSPMIWVWVTNQLDKVWTRGDGRVSNHELGGATILAQPI